MLIVRNSNQYYIWDSQCFPPFCSSIACIALCSWDQRLNVSFKGSDGSFSQFQMNHGHSTTYSNLKIFKGALDKYNIYLFISNSIEDFKLNQYRKFQLILPMRFHFMRYLVNINIFRVPHRLLYCVFIEVDFEK